MTFYILFTLIILGLTCWYLSNQQELLRNAGVISPVAPNANANAFLQSIGSSEVISDGENNINRQAPPIPDVVFHGDRTKKQVALTFDADMTDWMEQQLRTGRVKSYYDSHITDILEKTNTKATLFLAGEWIEMYPEVTKQLAQNPLFELANHSYSHPAFSGSCYGLPTIPTSQDSDQIEKTQKLLKNTTLKDNSYFRFPGGCYTQKNVDIVVKEGLKVIDWDVVGGDSFFKTSNQISNHVIQSIQNGSIIVLHLMGYPNAPGTADALPAIISSLKAKGYEFVTISELLDTQNVSKAFNYKDYLN